MNVQEAAKEIGCSISYVRWLCRQGKLAGRKRTTVSPVKQVEMDEWEITPAAVRAFKNLPKRDGRGRPRSGAG